MKTRKIGRFFLSENFFKDLVPGAGVSLFAGMVVLTAQQNPITGGTEYVAVHADFEELPEGNIVTEYHPIFSTTSAVPRWVKSERRCVCCQRK